MSYVAVSFEVPSVNHLNSGFPDVTATKDPDGQG